MRLHYGSGYINPYAWFDYFVDKYYFTYDFVANLLVGNKTCYVYMTFIILFVGLSHV